jgi:nucleotide-binding universal stress UspA family protein
LKHITGSEIDGKKRFVHLKNVVNLGQNLNYKQMKLLVALDLSPITEIILDTVKTIAKKANSKVLLLHVLQPDPDFVGYGVGPQAERDFVAKKFQDDRTLVQSLAGALSNEGLTVTPMVIQGNTVDTILEEADKMDADMIVTGSHGYGMMYKLFVGSVSKEVLRRSRRPVLIVPVKNED